MIINLESPLKQNCRAAKKLETKQPHEIRWNINYLHSHC